MLFYHSGAKQRAVVGTVRVVRDAYLDSSTHTWQVVDITADLMFKNAVTLTELERNPKLQNSNWRARRSHHAGHQRRMGRNS